MLLAISANSPFLDGRDSGLHSARTQIFTKSFPRCGVPDAFGSWDAFAEYIEFLVRTRSIVEYTQVWWSIRPHLSFGTVEVRICDAQATAGRVRRAGGADRRLRRPGGARHRRGRAGRRPARPADRGEHVAGDALRPRRRAARPRAARALPGGRRAASGCWRGPRRCAPSSGSRSRCRRSTAPSASGGCSRSGMSLHEVYAAVQAETRETYFWGAGRRRGTSRGTDTARQSR